MEADQALESLRGLDKANLAADLCSRFVGTNEYVIELIESYENISIESALEILKDLRISSGFPAPRYDQVRNAILVIRKKHAQAAIACMVADMGTGNFLTEVVEDQIDCWEDKGIRLILEAIVREYDVWSQPKLDSIKDRIRAHISKCKKGSDQFAVDPLLELLAEWDAISQPVQLIEQKKGHEEPRSKEIYEIVSEFCLWVGKETGQFDKALEISRALLETFPELELVASQLSRDVVWLDSLASIQRLTEAKDAIGDLSGTTFIQFSIELVELGFGPQSLGLSKTLYDAFASAASQTRGTEFADAPWMIVRSLAIELGNSLSPFGESALSILDGLISHTDSLPSSDVAEMLRRDRITLMGYSRRSIIEDSKANRDRSVWISIIFLVLVILLIGVLWVIHGDLVLAYILAVPIIIAVGGACLAGWWLWKLVRAMMALVRRIC